MPINADIIGTLAATLTTLCWAPQALRILRTRDTKAISLVTQSAFAGGVALWLIYGLMIGSAPVIVANAVTFVLVSAIVAMKIRFG
ncbi:MAG: SemiSWEET transporter [Hyphomicrobiales bacterium]|nr:SemiSWEET transporter [Hyphomicrobiales bacterium]